MFHHTPFSIIESVRNRACQSLDGLLNQGFRQGNAAQAFEEIRDLLEALPLNSEEFALAVNRLASALQYHQSGEHGAARYELRLLRRSLER